RQTKDCVVVGYSLNGYIAYRLACMLPGISYCVIVDTTHPSLEQDYRSPNRPWSLFKNLWRQVVSNGDLYYPVSLLRHLYLKMKEPPGGSRDVHLAATSFYLSGMAGKTINN